MATESLPYLCANMKKIIIKMSFFIFCKQSGAQVEASYFKHHRLQLINCKIVPCCLFSCCSSLFCVIMTSMRMCKYKNTFTYSSKFSSCKHSGTPWISVSLQLVRHFMPEYPSVYFKISFHAL